MKKFLQTIVLSASVVGFSGAAFGQAQVAFGGLQHDASLPVEVTADQLQVNQQDGSAVFQGNVVIGQGTMRLSAGRVRVEYQTGANTTGEISRLHATNGVVLTNGAEAAEATSAIYTIGSGQIVMQGGVILTQGDNALGANQMTVNLGTGQAELSGRVHTILQTGGN
ncbi:LptA/OstA family protein [Thalassobius sp. I31.1]|uniref:LptA/OstA family protein n=1 Tax=Thalassobius sp. I31.1 TaxID=2109912 RepID=UPI000D19DEC0|nr:LptA/OstA family protein [Thalassobius sp. I31.1]